MSTRLSAVAVLALSAWWPGPGVAADVEREFALTLTVEGTESTQDGSDWSKTTRKHRYEFSTRLRSDGVLQNYNPKDPAEVARQQARAAAVQRRVLAAQSRAPRPQGPSRSMEQLAAEMQKAQAACAGNTQCLMALAQRMSSPEMQAQMQSAQQSLLASRCQELPDAAQRKQCLELSGAVAPDPAAGQDDEALLSAEDSEKHLYFAGYDGCPTRVKVKIDIRTEGEYADVQGMVPYTIDQTADWNGDASTRLLCLSYTNVLDTHSNTLWFDLVGVPAPPGTYVHRESRRTDRNDNSEISLPGEILTWLNDSLRVSPAAGTRSATLPINVDPSAGSKHKGEARVSATWSFR